MLIEHHPSHLK
jgi:hypothetical protein